MFPSRAYLGAVAVAATLMMTAASAGDRDGVAGMAAVQAAVRSCLSDRAQLCPDVTPGQGRVLACLVAQADQLSPLCAAAMQTASDALIAAGRATRPSPLVNTSLDR